MANEFKFMFVLVFIGMLTKKFSWKGWFLVCLLLTVFILYTWKRGSGG